jgi:copper chaperone CopZ
MIYLLLIVFLFFTGCINFSHAKKNQKINCVKKKFKKSFDFQVTNLHCKLCAYNLVKFIAKIEGVLNVKFNYIAKDYQQSFFTVVIDSSKTTHDQVTIPLIKSGFLVKVDQKQLLKKFKRKNS